VVRNKFETQKCVKFLDLGVGGISLFRGCRCIFNCNKKQAQTRRNEGSATAGLEGIPTRAYQASAAEPNRDGPPRPRRFA